MSNDRNAKSTGESHAARQYDREALYYDHLGNVYGSMDELCEAYGIKRATFRYRRRNGWDLRRALTEPMAHQYHHGRCEDHLGTVYSNFENMCKSYEVPVWLVQLRLYAGHDLEYALTNDLNMDDEGEALLAVKDFSSIDDICDYYNISSQSLKKRLKRGMSLRDALLEDTNYNNNNITVDYKGVKFRSFAEMCRHYGKRVGTVSYRLSQGYSLKDALTKDDCRYLGQRKKDLDDKSAEKANGELPDDFSLDDLKNHPLYDWLFN